jgi:hypothetical protein
MEHHCLQWIKAKLMTARPSPLARTRAYKMPISRNLLRRPAKPALNNGPVQRGAERALIAHNGGPITTSEAVEWAYALRRYQGKPICRRSLTVIVFAVLAKSSV